MTRYVVDIDEIVLRGVAAEEARDLRARVEQRLLALVSSPDDVRRGAPGEHEADLADRLARSIWAEVRDARAAAPTDPTGGTDR